MDDEGKEENQNQDSNSFWQPTQNNDFWGGYGNKQNTSSSTIQPMTEQERQKAKTLASQIRPEIPNTYTDYLAQNKDLFRETGTKSNYGLNKAIYKHNVSRGEATGIPGYIKRTPVESSPYGQNIYEISRPDGKYRVITSTTPNGKTISSMYKIDR